ncbi:hypothetical protein A9R05_21295 [Burkholderia sp. KK1]|nr:hypothetical protein A9R05_21295 [Burkholderia sp. KK1]
MNVTCRSEVDMLRVTVLNVAARGPATDVLGYADICLERAPAESASYRVQLFGSIDGMESTARLVTPNQISLWDLIARSLDVATIGLQQAFSNERALSYEQHHVPWDQSR